MKKSKNNINLKKIFAEVEKLYSSCSDECLSKWFFKGHVKVVVDYSRKIASENKLDVEICVLASLFHDISRVSGIDDDPELMDESLKMTEQIMKRYSYDKNKIKSVKDAIINHSCRDKIPKTKEGKAVATADALAHLMTDFYLVLIYTRWGYHSKSLKEYRSWVLKKIDRDYNKKIFFPKYKKLAKKRYEAIKEVFTEHQD